jgi:hypothetical protein
VSGAKEQVSVVLVHGAWADGSSWNDVIGPLLSEGCNVLAAPIPLTSLTDDVAALERTLERTNGPVVLMHLYGGTVHSFTNRKADERGRPEAIRYSPKADARSWTSMQELLSQTLS